MAHTGVMVALYPDRRHLGRLSRVAASLPNAQSAEALHVTICYLGKAAALEPFKVLILAALMDVAEHAPVPLPLELRIRGAGRFDTVEDDGTQAIYAAIQCPELHTLRDAIKASLASVGAVVDQTFPEYRPHITLGYIASYLPTPAVRVPLVTIPAATLYLCWGDEKIAMPMRAAPRRAVALEAKAVAAVPSAALAHGPGGLFSNPALEGSGWLRRRTIRRPELGAAPAVVPAAWTEGNDTATRGKSLTSPLRGSQAEVSTKPFRSTAQQRWAFATGQPFAERWADETDFGGLPARVARRKSKSAQRRQMRLKASGDPIARLRAAGVNVRGDLIGVWYDPKRDQYYVSGGDWAASGTRDKIMAALGPDTIFADETGAPARFTQSFRLKASASDQGSGSASGGGYSARAGQVISGRLMRGADGKFTADGAAAPSTPARPPTRRKPKKARGGKAPKLTPEQRRAQREAERAAELAKNLEAAFEASGLNEDAFYSLMDFASGETDAPDGEKELIDAGLVEQAEDGSYRMTPKGKAFVRAAKKGDKRAVKDTLSQGREQISSQREAEAEAEAAAELAKEGEEKPKKGGGSGGGSDDPEKEPTAGAGRSALRGAGPSQGPGAGGGGGSSGGKFAGRQGPAKPGAPKEGEPKETTEERQARRSAERQAELDARRERAALDKATRIADAIDKAGIEPDAFFALRDWSEGGTPGPGQFPAVVQLASLGLLDDQLEVSNEGRRALSALERGDVRQYFAAVQAGQRRLEREAERAERDARRSVEEKKSYKHGKHNQASHGRKGRAGKAGAAAYQAARSGGASHSEALAAGRQATAAERAAERAERGAKRTGSLQTQAQRARRAANSDQVTPAQRARLLEKADRLEARARGEQVGPRQKPGAAKADGDPTRAYGTDPNQSYQLQHRVVDMADLKASNLANGAINPDYDPALQPRDRSRAASQAQIDQVARNLNPDVLVTDFHRIDAGSPIIDANGNVLSGNGRTLALQRAADMNPAQYAAYKARLKDEAERLGIDPKSIDGMRNPVLVRELKGDADPVAFAREANSSGTLRMSPLEQAKVDAGLVSDRSLLKLNVRDGQDIDKALRDPSNKTFINDFLATVPDNERANLLTRNGELNQMGLYRAKAALYTKAFPGEAGSRLAESMLESLDPDVKTIQNGISASLPNISRVTALMRNGDRDSSLDLSEDFAKTIDVYARIKDNPAMTANTPANQLVSKYLGQSQMFDRELTPDQEVLLRHIDTISRRPSAVRDMFNNWAQIVENQPPPGQSSLFGEAGGMTRRELIDALIRGDTGGSSQAGMFDG
jgi:2'-5' RNA ligase